MAKLLKASAAKRSNYTSQFPNPEDHLEEYNKIEKGQINQEINALVKFISFLKKDIQDPEMSKVAQNILFMKDRL